MSTKTPLVAPGFNLLDPSREPSDEELSALMRAMQQRVRQKSAETAHACREKLAEGLDQASQDMESEDPSPTFPSAA